MKEFEKKYPFENYLMDLHAKQYRGTDDAMPDDYEDWISNMDNAELIELGNKAIKLLNK